MSSEPPHVTRAMPTPGVAEWSIQSSDLIPRQVDSPRLAEMIGDDEIDARLRASITQQYPWIEPLEDGWCAVTWLATLHPGEHIYLIAGSVIGYPSVTPEIGAFTPIPQASLGSLTLRLPADSIFSYHIARSTEIRPDSVLDRGGWMALAGTGEVDEFATMTSCGIGGEPVSVVRLPEARPDVWPATPPVRRRGELVASEVQSKALDRTVRFWVHRPSRMTRATPRLVLLDGEVWNERCSIADLLDQLIEDEVIQPVVVIMPEGGSPQTRMEELTLKPAYLDFLIGELLPAADPDGVGSTSAGSTGEPVAIGGWSLGGLTAAFAAITEPRFRTVLSLSGSFWWPIGTPFDQDGEAATRMLARSADVLPTEWYLEVGRGERIQLAQNRHFADLARARGHRVTAVEHGGAHDVLNARIGLAAGLKSLFGQATASV